MYVSPIMEIYWLCAAGFLAGLVDSMVGGGGLVQAPAFFILYPHLSVPQVIGSNRFASVFGTAAAAWNYSRAVSIPWRAALYGGLGAAICSYVGATLQSKLPATALKPILLVMMILLVGYTYRRKDFGRHDHLLVTEHNLPMWAAGIGAVMGFYNGFVGPGTGSLLVFAFVRFLGYGFLRASAISKVVNVMADVSSLMFFFIYDYILYQLALPLMVCNVAGSVVGSRLAVSHGNQFIRRVFLAIVSLIIARFAWDVWRLLFG